MAKRALYTGGALTMCVPTYGKSGYFQRKILTYNHYYMDDTNI